MVFGIAAARVKTTAAASSHPQATLLKANAATAARVAILIARRILVRNIRTSTAGAGSGSSTFMTI